MKPAGWLVTWPEGCKWFPQRAAARGFVLVLRAQGVAGVDARPAAQ